MLSTFSLRMSPLTKLCCNILSKLASRNDTVLPSFQSSFAVNYSGSSCFYQDIFVIYKWVVYDMF